MLATDGIVASSVHRSYIIECRACVHGRCDETLPAAQLQDGMGYNTYHRVGPCICDPGFRGERHLPQSGTLYL